MSARRILTTAGLATAGLLALAGPAAAHVTPSVTSAPAGSYLKFDLRVPHGCGETGNTNKVEVSIPEGITSVTPQVVPGWTIERTIEQLGTPLDDGHGGQITERTSVVTWTGGPLAHDQLEEFGLSVKLPDAAGTTITFPTVQTCDDGATSEWIQVATDDGEEPEKPAPAIELTAADGDGHGDGAASDDAATEDSDDDSDDVDAETASATSSSSDDDSDSSTAIAVAGLVVGAAGLAVGGTALRRTRS